MDNFDSVSSKTKSDAILRALGFHHSTLDYLKKGTPWFVDITDKSELAIELKDNAQPITDSEDKKMRKKLERTAKKKARRNNLCAFMRQVLAGDFTALVV